MYRPNSRFLTLSIHLVVLVLSASSAYTQFNVHGVVAKVLDCQTIEVRTGATFNTIIRLQGFECPAEGQALAAEATEHLAKKVLNQRVVIRASRIGGTAIDGFVFVQEADTARQMLRDGAGWLVFEEPSPVGISALEDYQRQQDAARAEKRGVWGIPGLIPPSQLAAAAQKANDPFNDSALAQMAWNSLGSTVEGLFGKEIYSLENNSCGGTVIKVIDGDTVRVRTPDKGDTTVRLAGIDAPELRQVGGAASRQMLTEMVLGKTVACESFKKDRYGRYVGKIEVEGKDIGLAMIRQGGAWHYKAYQGEQSPSDRFAYASAESSCRAVSCGLFTGTPMAPWDFRKKSFNAMYIAPPALNDSGGDTGGYGGSYGGGYSSGGTVNVRGYTRSDGTFVRGHTRSSPGRRR